MCTENITYTNAGSGTSPFHTRGTYTQQDSDVVDCVKDRHHFSILPKSKCASPGDDITVECEVNFGNDNCTKPYYKRVLFKDGNGTRLSGNNEMYKNMKLSFSKG